MCHGCIKKAKIPRQVWGKMGTWGCVPALTILADFGVVRFGEVKLSELRCKWRGEERQSFEERRRRDKKPKAEVPSPRARRSSSPEARRELLLSRCSRFPAFPNCPSLLLLPPSLTRSQLPLCQPVSSGFLPVANFGWLAPLGTKAVPARLPGPGR